MNASTRSTSGTPASTTTVHAQWWAQNDATNADGFLMNSQDDGEAVFTAEREALREMGAPDTDSNV